MQVFRLVSHGFPDRVIAFDTLPEEYVRSVHTNPPAGLARHWARWLEENGSVNRDGKPIFYVLDYILTNGDKQAWENITNFTRRAVDTSFRLMDRMEDMAKPFAKDARADITLEPENVVVIPIPDQAADKDQEESFATAAPFTRKTRKSKEI